MESLRQLATFDAASEAFDLLYRLEFALRGVANDWWQDLGNWQRRATSLEDKLLHLAAQANTDQSREQVRVAVNALQECRVALVAFFEQNQPPESKLSELQRINETATEMQADWDASEQFTYSKFIRETVTELLQPFLASLGVLEDNLPDELKPFFAFVRSAFLIANDLNDWVDENPADRLRTHRRILYETRPRLQEHLQQCVDYQPELHAVWVGSLVLDNLEEELSDLRLAVRQKLVDLSSRAARAGSGSGAVEGVPSERCEDSTSSTSTAAEVGSGSGEVGSEPRGSEVSATATNAATEADAEEEKTEVELADPEGEELASEVGKYPPIPPIVPVEQDKKVPFKANKQGVEIYGIQVEIRSDAKNLLICFCNSTRQMDYADIKQHLNELRTDTTNKSTFSTEQVSDGAARRIMTSLRTSLRAAFDDPSGEPIKSDEYEPHHRFTLDREWLATQFEKINRNTPQSD